MGGCAACGQTRPSVNPDQGHCAALMAWMVAELTEFPPQDARGTVLEQASLIWKWLPTRPCPTPQPLPPREDRTQNMKSFNQNHCETGAERGKARGRGCPWWRQNRRQAWPQLTSPGGNSCSSCRRCWAQPVKQQSQEEPQARASAQPCSTARTVGRSMVCNTHFKASGTCQPGAAWRHATGRGTRRCSRQNDIEACPLVPVGEPP